MEVNRSRILELSPRAKMVTFRISKSDPKRKSLTLFSEPSNEFEVKNITVMLLAVGVGAIVILFLFIFCVVLCIKKYNKNHTKDAKKEFKYSTKPYHQTYTPTHHHFENNRPFLIRYVFMYDWTD